MAPEMPIAMPRKPEHGRQRDDEGRDLVPGDQPALTRADRRAQRPANQDREIAEVAVERRDDAEAVLHQARHDQRGERDDRTDRQVDAAGDHDDGLADGDEADRDRDVLGEEDQVGGLAEGGRDGREDDDQQRQPDQPRPVRSSAKAPDRGVERVCSPCGAMPSRRREPSAGLIAPSPCLPGTGFRRQMSRRVQQCRPAGLPAAPRRGRPGS